VYFFNILPCKQSRVPYVDVTFCFEMTKLTTRRRN